VKVSYFSQMIITLCGLAVVISLMYFFIVAPLFNEIKENKNRFVEGQRRLLSLQRTEQELNSLRQEVREVQELEPLLSKTSVNPEDSLAFIIALENIGKQTKVEYDINVGGPAAPARTPRQEQRTLPFQVNVSGQFGNVARFIEGVERMSYYVQINRIQISRKGKEDEVAASINLSAFSK